MADKKSFSMPKHEDAIERHKDRYVKVNPHGINEIYYGKLVKIYDSGYGKLNPYMDVDYGGKEPIRKITKDKDKKGGITVPLTAGAITPFPRKNLKAFCVFWNNQDREAKKEKKQLEKRLEKRLKD